MLTLSLTKKKKTHRGLGEANNMPPLAYEKLEEFKRKSVLVWSIQYAC